MSFPSCRRFKSACIRDDAFEERPGTRLRSLGITTGLLMTLVATAVVSAQQPRREPVLQQVEVPHGYYWREMYVPQATSGPSAVTWSPDGRDVIYSMQGSLWRQRLGTTEARQLTTGPRYDYQPDWSPDGRFVVFSSYDGNAIDLRVLDLARGTSTTILANGAVNLEPRWSPDGARLAFVSTAFNARWHVFVGSVVRLAQVVDSQPDASTTVTSLRLGGVRLDSIERITEDTDSGLPRYYYSPFDHYLSPTWSPDSRELILVSNRGRIYGTGGIWRMEARAGAPMRELHFEETTWKARPDWASDGKRVVYSGYHGRQWNQLWLLASDGGDPIQITYGEFDAVAPRWSRDARRIAYISNEGGNTSLWIVDVPGGKRTRVEARTRTYASPVGRLVVTVVDSATRQVLPARVSVAAASTSRDSGRFYAPRDAWRHADEARVRGEQRLEYGYFHTAGRDTVTVPSGPVTVEVWRGPEYRTVRREITVAPNATREVRIALSRLSDPPRRGWWGGDMHVHMNYGGAYRNTPAHLSLQARAEGLNVVENLVVNKEQRIPDITYWRPSPDPVSTRDFVLAHGQEFHTGFWGHAGLVGLGDHYLLPDYSGYAGTALASLFPTNAAVADLAHAQGGLMGYVHPFDFRPDLSRVEGGIPYELPVDVALGKVDYMEVMGNSDHLITSEVWYRLLNCGFRVPAGAGTDAFPNFAALRGPPGLVRVYARTGAGQPLDHRRWLAAVRAGRTFVTNAPVLEFTLGGHEIGDEIRIQTGEALRAHVRLRSPVAVDHLEIIGNGRVVASLPLSGDRMSADTTIAVQAPGSGWFVVRAWSDRPRLPVLDLYPFASTSPIYVQVGSSPVRSAVDADYFLGWLDRVDLAVAADKAWNTPAERDEVIRMLEAARAEFARRRPR
jgi:Tol biopolymer transport system component